MKWIIGLTVFTVLLAAYVVAIRPMMRKTEWGQNFLDTIEPVERVLWLKSETILWNRFKMLLGTVLYILLSTDLSPFMLFVPEKYRPYVAALPTIALALDGLIGEYLRRDTSKPLAVVAMRSDAPIEVQAAVAAAEANMKQASAEVTISEAVADGSV